MQTFKTLGKGKEKEKITVKNLPLILKKHRKIAHFEAERRNQIIHTHINNNMSNAIISGTSKNSAKCGCTVVGSRAEDYYKETES
jgi:hypothetical protein